MLDFRVATDKCISCGMCVADCPSNIIELVDGYPAITNEAACMRCQHCLAVCPEGAISILGYKPEDCVPLTGFPTQEQMELLIKGRRSVRQYAPQNVDPGLLRHLAETAWHAPTGCNTQGLHVTLLDDRDVMQRLREKLYARVAEIVERGELPPPPMQAFVVSAFNSWKAGGDFILRTAPHAVIVTPTENAVCRKEDALIYLSAFDLLAQSAGLGTVWCGVLHGFLQFMPDIRQEFGLPDGGGDGYAMLVGYPQVVYARTINRTNYNIHRVEQG